MNQGRIWTIVPPAVGLPLIIGGAAVTSLVVHACLLTHTTWMSGYWQGKGAKMADMGSSSAVALNSGMSVSVTPTQNANGTTSFVVSVVPAPAAVASADPVK